MILVVGFYTQALSDLLALETLRHGTNYHNYLSIRMNGADPTYGGCSNGASAGSGCVRFVENSKSYFHVLKDSEAKRLNLLVPEPVNILISQTLIRLFPRLFCYLSGAATVKGDGLLIKIQKIFIGTINALFVPTINFRFRPEEIAARFENDPDFSSGIRNTDEGMAYRTRLEIGTDHIGLKGVINQGFQGNVFERMKAYPSKVAFGFIKLLNPVGIIILAGATIALAGKELSTYFCEREIRPVYY